MNTFRMTTLALLFLTAICIFFSEEQLLKPYRNQAIGIGVFIGFGFGLIGALIEWRVEKHKVQESRKGKIVELSLVESRQDQEDTGNSPRQGS